MHVTSPSQIMGVAALLDPKVWSICMTIRLGGMAKMCIMV